MPSWLVSGLGGRPDRSKSDALSPKVSQPMKCSEPSIGPSEVKTVVTDGNSRETLIQLTLRPFGRPAHQAVRQPRDDLDHLAA